MNDGQICVTVCAKTAGEFIEKITQAAKLADLLELRFDCLDQKDFDPADFDPAKKAGGIEMSKSENLLRRIAKLDLSIPVIYTLRPAEQGGKQKFSIESRRLFWDHCHQTAGADFEADIIRAAPAPDFNPVIASHHDFISVPDNLEVLYSNLAHSDPDIVKIAVKARNLKDSVAVFKLLFTDSDRPPIVPIVPIAMGEHGNWTRILGLGYGSPLTYGSLQIGDETAPGQITVSDLKEVYRVKKLNPETEVYGIIGNPVSQSLSPYLHNAAFNYIGSNAVYIPFTVNDLEEFLNVMVKASSREIELNIKGFSVTIPYKESIIKYLDVIDGRGKKIGSVNTVKIIGGKLYGYNTDVDGFIGPLKNEFPDLKGARVAVIGAGGAARAAVYALAQEDADAAVFARNRVKARALTDDFGVNIFEYRGAETRFNDFDIVVNTSPLGMAGSHVEKTPATSANLKNVRVAFDLVYNPLETLFLREARVAGAKPINGFEMFVLQGVRQFEVWTGIEAPAEIMRAAAKGVGTLKNGLGD